MNIVKELLEQLKAGEADREPRGLRLAVQRDRSGRRQCAPVRIARAVSQERDTPWFLGSLPSGLQSSTADARTQR